MTRDQAMGVFRELCSILLHGVIVLCTWSVMYLCWRTTYVKPTDYGSRVIYMSPYNCSDIDQAVDIRTIGKGEKHLVNLVSIDGTEVVRKVLLDKQLGKTEPTTHFLYEIMIQQTFEHPNLVQQLGFCVRGAFNTGHKTGDVTPIVQIQEVGESFNNESVLARFELKDRVKLASDVAGFLTFLKNSTLGHLAIGDFVASDYIIVGGTTIKYLNAGTLNVIEPFCNKTDKKVPECTHGCECVDNACRHYRERQNANHLYYFVKHTLEEFNHHDDIKKTLEKIRKKRDKYELKEEYVSHELTKIMNSL